MIVEMTHPCSYSFWNFLCQCYILHWHRTIRVQHYWLSCCVRQAELPSGQVDLVSYLSGTQVHSLVYTCAIEYNINMYTLFEVVDKSMHHLDRYKFHATCPVHMSSKSSMSCPDYQLQVEHGMFTKLNPALPTSHTQIQ